MPFVEVYSPAGAVSEEQRNRISERLIPEVMEAEGVPDTEAVRSLSWLVWHEPVLWSIGGKTLGPGDAPPFMVRVGIPAASLNDEKRAEIVKRVTQVLADADENPERFYAAPPASFIVIDELREGNLGSAGMVFRFHDIVSYALKGAPGLMTEEEVSEALRLGRERIAEPASS